MPTNVELPIDFANLTAKSVDSIFNNGKSRLSVSLPGGAFNAR